MSYVIQNFNNFNKKISLTPRVKFLLLLINLEKFFIFFKFNTFLHSFLKKYKFNLNAIKYLIFVIIFKKI